MKAVVLVCAGFVALAVTGLDRLGVQTDEALFAGGLYAPFAEERVVRVGLRDVPLMVFDYVGSLKSALMGPVVGVFGVSVYTVRVPPILLAAAAIGLYWGFLRRLAGERAALLAAVLLAADPCYLMTARLDWGPVAVQQLLKAAAIYAGVRWWREGQGRWLWMAGVALGLGLWDKTLFAWALAGMGVALVVAHPVGLWRRRSWASAGRLVAGFVMGAAPWLWFNARTGGRSFGGELAFSVEAARHKAVILLATLDGTVMRGLFTVEPSQVDAPRGGLAVLFVLSAAAVWWVGRRGWFLLASFLGVWGAMLVTKEAGGSVHHTVLAYPFPHLLIGAALARFSEGARWRAAVSWGLVVVCAAGGLRLTADYYGEEARAGGNNQWNETVNDCNAALRRAPERRVALLDWGLYDNTRLFQQGGKELWAPGAMESEEEQAEGRAALARGGTVYVRHLPGWEVMEGQGARFLAFAEREGYVRQGAQVFRDRQGRAVLEAFRLVRGRS